MPNYFVCTYGNFDRGSDFLEDSINKNVYRLHHCARYPSALNLIQKGDIILLQNYCYIVAWGIAESPMTKDAPSDWCYVVSVKKWHSLDESNLEKGIHSYGIRGATEVGGSMAVVKKVAADWAQGKLKSFASHYTPCPTSNDNARFPDEPVIPLPLLRIASYFQEGFLRIPAVQRGKVWNAVRAEILWDSLLRNIPIGTLSIRPVQDNEVKKCYWDLLDGQQRTNAIAMGFSGFPSKESSDEQKKEPLLWLDLGMLEANTEREDTKIRRSERKFFFKVTTAAHPWGYKLSDNENRNTTLKEWKKKEAVEKLGGRWEKHTQQGTKPYPYELWPVDAIYPVPFDVIRKFVEQGSSTLEDFHNYCIDKYCDCNWVCRYLDGDDVAKKYSFPTINESHWNEIIKAIREDLPRIVIFAQNSKHISDENIGLYFRRMNKAGVEPSDEEIQYSLLKSKVPSLKELDELADGLMQPSRLANIAMLSYLTREGKWNNDISIANIRTLSKDQNFVNYIRVRDEGEDGLKFLLDKIKEKVVYSSNNECGIPRVNYSSIARRYPALFRLLIYFADKGFEIENQNLIAFISLIVLYGTGMKISAGYNYYKDAQDWLIATKNWFAQAIKQGELLIPPTPEVYQGIVEAVNTEDFTKVDIAWNNLSYKASIDITWNWKSSQGRFLLLYATRKYLEEYFPGYDPVDVTWCEENCPWDFDHIFPQDWLGYHHGEYRQLVQKFLLSIGNVAPITFSKNRGMGANPPGKYLQEDNEKVFVTYEPFFDERHSGKQGSTRLEMDKNLAFTFAKITAIRWSKVYNEFYKSTDLEKLLDFSSINDRRYKLFKSLQDQDSEIECYYVLPNGAQQIVSSNIDLFRPWVACGRTGKITIEGNEYPCLVCVVSNGVQWEVGVRRHPDVVALFDKPSKWWFDGFYERVDNLSDPEILEKFNSLLKDLDMIKTP